ncbi:caspase-1-like [Stomoxys calcitrans]|uniref:caspase-1-like n=1 Tax=Stomoxys calcitrans TaxID=35570 RepID=UPI0027E3AD4E|nr:caspase-1-like [Stomoxys calcitrans]
MNRNRGYALLFFHSEYADKAKRPGALADLKDVEDAFKRKLFEVETFLNKKANDVIRKTEEYAKMDHAGRNCIAIIISTKLSREGNLRAYDDTYDADKLLKFFTPDRCPSLAGKPKLFFIQAESANDSSVCTDTRDVYLPLHADFLVAYSSVPDYVSLCSVPRSVFLQELAEILINHGTYEDLVTLLTFVNRNVALYLEENYKDNWRKQILPPSFTSTLLHNVRFV